MITGYDEVILIGQADLSPVINEVLQRLLVKWPEMMVWVEGFPDSDFRSLKSAIPHLPEVDADILIAPTPEILARWDGEGYFTSEDGIGPLALMYTPCKKAALRVEFLDQPFRRQSEETSGYEFGFSPYEAQLFGWGCSLLTIVTGDDSEGMREILHQLIQHVVADTVK